MRIGVGLPGPFYASFRVGGGGGCLVGVFRLMLMALWLEFWLIYIVGKLVLTGCIAGSRWVGLEYRRYQWRKRYGQPRGRHGLK